MEKSWNLVCRFQFLGRVFTNVTGDVEIWIFIFIFAKYGPKAQKANMAHKLVMRLFTPTFYPDFLPRLIKVPASLLFKVDNDFRIRAKKLAS